MPRNETCAEKNSSLSSPYSFPPGAVRHVRAHEPGEGGPSFCFLGRPPIPPPYKLYFAPKFDRNPIRYHPPSAVRLLPSFVYGRNGISSSRRSRHFSRGIRSFPLRVTSRWIMAVTVRSFSAVRSFYLRIVTMPPRPGPNRLFRAPRSDSGNFRRYVSRRTPRDRLVKLRLNSYVRCSVRPVIGYPACVFPE